MHAPERISPENLADYLDVLTQAAREAVSRGISLVGKLVVVSPRNTCVPFVAAGNRLGEAPVKLRSIEASSCPE
jgi:hypothetical protein